MEHCEDEEEMDAAETSSSSSDPESEEADDARDEEQQKELWRKVEELRQQVGARHKGDMMGNMLQSGVGSRVHAREVTR